MSSIKLPLRLLVIFYDLLLVTAVIMVTTLLVLALRQFEPIVPETLWFQCILGAAIALFYIGSWSYKRQTLGMKAWKVMLESNNGSVSLQQCILRFFVSLLSLAVFGLGFFWSLWDKEKRTWHDMASGTRLVRSDPTDSV